MKTNSDLKQATYFVVDEIQQANSDLITELLTRFNHLNKETLMRNIKKVLVEESLLIDFNINISIHNPLSKNN